MKNLFDLPDGGKEEIIEKLVEKGRLGDKSAIKIEHILSYGQATPADHYYEQNWDEWVMIIKGEAILSYDDGRGEDLRTGDSLLIKRGERHRVDYTSEDCIWIAVSYNA